MADDSRVVAGRASERTTVTGLLLDVADDSTLRQLRDREDVADRKLGLLAAVDEGTGVETLRRDESLLAELVTVGVAEDDTGKGSTTARRSACLCTGSWICNYAPASVVDDLLHNTLDVAIALRKVEGAELRRRLVVVGVGFELDKQPSVLNGRCACKRCGTYDSVRPPLCPNYPTHDVFCREKASVSRESKQTSTDARKSKEVHPDVAQSIQPEVVQI